MPYMYIYKFVHVYYTHEYLLNLYIRVVSKEYYQVSRWWGTGV